MIYAVYTPKNEKNIKNPDNSRKIQTDTKKIRRTQEASIKTHTQHKIHNKNEQ